MMERENTGLRVADGVLRWVTFAALGAAVLPGPWFFGAWEMWWFWPFVAAIAMGVAATGARLLLPGGKAAWGAFPASAWLLVLVMLPFLLYAGVWLCMADVFMDAQRLVLLHVTAWCIGFGVLLGLSGKQRRLLFGLMVGNLLIMGLYGIVNHLVWGSEHVLWAPRYEQYVGRAMGPYFCPDHYAGAMELLLCLALGLILARGYGRLARYTGAIAAIVAVYGVVLSRSRGGGLTLIVILAAALVWGVAQWPRAVRWYMRLIGVSAALLLLMGVLELGSSYVERFASYGGWATIGRDDSSVEQVFEALRRTSRGRMFGGAIRAWRSSPWLGIGPGMHQNLWPHFAPTPDGDPELGKWPSLPNYNFHSYEVHSDWLQLLEEYGVVGFVLFGAAFVVALGCFSRAITQAGRAWRKRSDLDAAALPFAPLLGGALALVAMGFHSLGDFNLQMPGTVWMFAAIMALALSVAPANVSTAPGE